MAIKLLSMDEALTTKTKVVPIAHNGTRAATRPDEWDDIVRMLNEVEAKEWIKVAESDDPKEIQKLKGKLFGWNKNHAGGPIEFSFKTRTNGKASLWASYEYRKGYVVDESETMRETEDIPNDEEYAV